jgi:dihydrofolate reductase
VRRAPATDRTLPVPRPTCSAFVATSLDGFIARPGGGLDWLAAVSTPAEDYGYRELFVAIDTVLLGRSTWEVARRFEAWPYRGKRVVVLAHAPVSGVLGERFVEGDAAGCVDELTVSVVPVVIGEGIRLFQPPLPERPLELVSARSFPTGLVQLRYRPRRA